MRRWPALVLALWFAARVQAQDRPPNELTAEEIAEGWALLFDGKTATRWKIEGDHEIVDGTLILGGNKETRAYFPIEVLRDFEVRFQYRTEGSKEAGIGFRSHREVKEAFRGITRPMLEPKKDWHDTFVREYFDLRHPSQRVIDYERGANGVFESMESLWIEAPAGTRVFLRCVRMKNKATSSWPLLISILFAVAGVTGVLLWRWRGKGTRQTTRDSHDATKQIG